MGAVTTEEGRDWANGDKKCRSRPEEPGTRKGEIRISKQNTSKLACFPLMVSALLQMTQLQSFYNSCLIFMSYFSNQYGLLRGQCLKNHSSCGNRDQTTEADRSSN